MNGLFQAVEGKGNGELQAFKGEKQSLQVVLKSKNLFFVGPHCFKQTIPVEKSVIENGHSGLVSGQ
jgi:hypothetical protein